MPYELSTDAARSINNFRVTQLFKTSLIKEHFRFFPSLSLSHHVIVNVKGLSPHRESFVLHQNILPGTRFCSISAKQGLHSFDFPSRNFNLCFLLSALRDFSSIFPAFDRFSVKWRFSTGRGRSIFFPNGNFVPQYNSKRV